MAVKTTFAGGEGTGVGGGFGVIGGGGGGGAAVIVTVLFPSPPVMLVPLPSLAKTEPEAKLIVLVPSVMAVSVSVTNRPADPVYPGLNTTPSNVAIFEAVSAAGAVVQYVKMEPPLEAPISFKPALATILPETALMAWPGLETYADTVNVLPAGTVTVDGEIYKFADAAATGVMAIP